MFENLSFVEVVNSIANLIQFDGFLETHFGISLKAVIGTYCIQTVSKSGW